MIIRGFAISGEFQNNTSLPPNSRYFVGPLLGGESVVVPLATKCYEYSTMDNAWEANQREIQGAEPLALSSVPLSLVGYRCFEASTHHIIIMIFGVPIYVRVIAERDPSVELVVEVNLLVGILNHTQRLLLVQ